MWGVWEVCVCVCKSKRENTTKERRCARASSHVVRAYLSELAGVGDDGGATRLGEARNPSHEHGFLGGPGAALRLRAPPDDAERVEAALRDERKGL